MLVYNDAKFCEEDWTGIKMLYSSIKEFDRTKVGRFGLGFKSVFHITGMIITVSFNICFDTCRYAREAVL